MIAVDLFAGLGGFSTGAEHAGITTRWAANHSPDACKWFSANHPDVSVACQDLHQADFTALPAHDVLLASPACQGHARARGRERPHHDAARSTAWAVVAAAETCRPSTIMIENVPEFRSWTLYTTWRSALTTLGYALSEQVIDAADVGVPQHRRRLLVVGTRSRHPLVLPPPPGGNQRPARSIIDLDAGTWSPVDKPGRADATLRRIARGRARFGSTFLIAYYGSERGGRSLDEPLGTVLTRARHAIVDGDRMRMLTVHELRTAMGFPDTYKVPDRIDLATHLLGNAVPPPLAAWALDAIRKAA